MFGVSCVLFMIYFHSNMLDVITKSSDMSQNFCRSLWDSTMMGSRWRMSLGPTNTDTGFNLDVTDDR